MENLNIKLTHIFCMKQIKIMGCLLFENEIKNFICLKLNHCGKFVFSFVIILEVLSNYN